jgi:hypothetical protein
LIFPLVLGQGKRIFQQDKTITLKLVTTKSFSKSIVKLTYGL